MPDVTLTLTCDQATDLRVILSDYATLMMRDIRTFNEAGMPEEALRALDAQDAAKALHHTVRAAHNASFKFTEE